MELSGRKTEKWERKIGRQQQVLKKGEGEEEGRGREGDREGRREEGRHFEFCFCCEACSFRRATIS